MKVRLPTTWMRLRSVRGFVAAITILVVIATLLLCLLSFDKGQPIDPEGQPRTVLNWFWDWYEYRWLGVRE